MSKRFTETRKWTPSKVEVAFENKLVENGFTVLGYKEAQSLTDFLIEKDNIKIEFRMYHSASVNANQCYKSLARAYDIKKEHEEVVRKFNNG